MPKIHGYIYSSQLGTLVALGDKFSWQPAIVYPL